jgi:N-acetylmuramoyl-L-alanine amidase
VFFDCHNVARRVLFVLAVTFPWALPARAEDAPFRILWHEKESYVALQDLARAYSCKMAGPAEHYIRVFNEWNTLEFLVDSREVKINGLLVWLHEPLRLVRGRWALREADARKVVDPVLRPELYLQEAGYRVIVLDPGHGGQDTGAKGVRGVEEKRAVLDITRRVRTHLVNAGLKVYLTRDGDRFIELEERCRKARRWGADLFVSIHLNAAASTDANGSETYVLAAAGFESTAGGFSKEAQLGNQFEGPNAVLGYQLQRAVTSVIREGDRGVKRARFLVLKNAPCPAALVECAFLSNRHEEQQVLREPFRELVAQGLARGILAYVSQVKRAKLSQPEDVP